MNITHDDQKNYSKDLNLNEVDNLLAIWAKPKGLLKPENKLAQLAKLLEESGELASGILKNDKELKIDSAGDIFVVLSLLCRQLGFSLQDAANHAYNEIKDRTGTISDDGSFIKD